MTTQAIYFLLGVLCVVPSLGIIFSAAWRSKWWIPWPMYPLLLVFAIGPLGIPFVWNYHPAYGIAYSAVTYAGAIVMAGFLTDAPFAEKWTVFMGVMLLYAVAVAAAFPLVMPRFSQHQNSAPKEALVSAVNAAFIRQSAAQIQVSMAGAVRDIQREQNRVEAATKLLIDQVERQNAVIRDLQRERSALAKEVEYQRALAALTKEQADAVRSSLTRGRYVDYLAGFFIGLASSVTASLALQLRSKSRLAKGEGSAGAE